MSTGEKINVILRDRIWKAYWTVFFLNGLLPFKKKKKALLFNVPEILLKQAICPLFQSTRPKIVIIWLSLLWQICVSPAWENPLCPLAEGILGTTICIYTQSVWMGNKAWPGFPQNQTTLFFPSAPFKDGIGGRILTSNPHCWVLNAQSTQVTWRTNCSVVKPEFRGLWSLDRVKMHCLSKGRICLILANHGWMLPRCLADLMSPMPCVSL